MTFAEKLYDICTLRYRERDEVLQRSMQNAFEEMNGRGMLYSGATAERIKEIVAVEFHESSQLLLKSAIEVHQLYYPKVSKEIVLNAVITMLHERLSKLEETKTSRLQTILSGLINANILQAIDLTPKIKIIETELHIQIDKYFSGLEVHGIVGSASKFIGSWSRGEKITVISILVAIILGAITVVTPEIRSLVGLNKSVHTNSNTKITQAVTPHTLQNLPTSKSSQSQNASIISSQKENKINIVGVWKGTFSSKNDTLGWTDAKKLEYRIKRPDDYGNITIVVRGWYGDDDSTIDYAKYREEIINGVRTGFLNWDDNYGVTDIRVTSDLMTGTIKPYPSDDNPLVELHLKKIN